MALAREWLRDCDINHEECAPRTSAFRPTRLIDVSLVDSPIKVRLYVPSPADTLRYLAMSERWGPDMASASTTKRNLEFRLNGIGIYELPGVVQDAIKTTRALGFRYLWVDAVRIVQGVDGDFQEEAERIGDVFAHADCVISGSGDLFGPRPMRNFVKIQRDTRDPLFICQVIDDFSKDVLQSRWRKRGWVFEQIALARRTIYFANAQGVRVRYSLRNAGENEVSC
jgi:hypothetical protein